MGLLEPSMILLPERRFMPVMGSLNLITDIPGLTVGHATDERACSGVTTLLCDGLWAAGVSVLGGGPGTRETEALAPENLVGGCHAVVLAGGSVFGLAAADGVAAVLSDRGIGLRIRNGSVAIPIVPSAALYDLDRGGEPWGQEPPYQALGRRSVDAADRMFSLGSVGAGRGAMSGVEKGGIGSASLDLGQGLVVGALAAVNCVGSVRMAGGETFWAWPFEIDGEFGGGRPTDYVPDPDPSPPGTRMHPVDAAPGAHTTLGVVAVSAALSASECKQVAIMAQDGVARAIRPVHTPFDGDTVFAVAQGQPAPETSEARGALVTRLGSAAADCLTRAIARGVHHA